MTKTLLNWTLTGRDLSFDYMGLCVYFRMPHGYEMPAPQLLRLAEWLMLSPWHDAPEPDPVAVGVWAGGTGDYSIGLAFSGGVDSTAALQLLPNDTTPVYCERHGIPAHLFDQRDQLAFCHEIGAEIVLTNFELVRTKHGLPPGYSTARGMGVPVVLLAEYHSLSGIAYGAVLDDTFFPHGTFRPLTGDWHARQARFRAAGLDCLSPVLGCSEVITCRLVEHGPYSDLCHSCIRGGCGICYKCFRKGMLRKGSLPQRLSADVLRAISKNPPKMAGPLIWGLQRWGHYVPGMEYIEGLDVSFLERYYADALHGTMSAEMENEIITALTAHWVREMTPIDIGRMKATDFRRPEAHE